MSEQPRQTRASVTESPWYWLYLFATAGLVALIVVGPKFLVRQQREEFNFRGRQQVMNEAAGSDQETRPDSPSPDETRITLTPLYLILAALLIFAWVNLWWRHFRFRAPGTSTTSASGTKSVRNPVS